MLDADDVLCVNAPYGGSHAHIAAYRPAQAPADLYERLFVPEAVGALNVLMAEFQPRVALTTTWIALLPNKEHFIDLFSKTGMPLVARNLHDHWAAVSNRGESRLHAIERWLERHHMGEPYLLLDDFESGASLVGSRHAIEGRAVLCEVGRGFHAGLLELARAALRRPFTRNT